MQLIKIVSSVFLVALIAIFGLVSGQTTGGPRDPRVTPGDFSGGTIRDRFGNAIYANRPTLPGMTTPA